MNQKDKRNVKFNVAYDFLKRNLDFEASNIIFTSDFIYHCIRISKLKASDIKILILLLLISYKNADLAFDLEKRKIRRKTLNQT